MKAVGFEDDLERVVIRPAHRLDAIDLPQGWEFRVIGTPLLRSIGNRRPRRRRVEIEKVNLARALVADVADLEYEPGTEFLLDIQAPDLSVGGFEVAVHASNVERRLRRACAICKRRLRRWIRR